ncbi:MAG: pirin family protein [Sphingobium sp.]|nr:pirin family protein [Sphingobium sp.]MCP5400125.1 pirin family protein [Sphingomonas sp.]
MSLKLRMDRMEHGAQFRAFVLRDHARTGAMDPVLGVDHAYMAGPTFPPHPHAGFSAVSYVFADAGTGLNNEDSIGTRNLIRPGGLHWTAAGRGIVHEEVPADDGKVAHLFQIFVNLPAGKQSAPPFAISLEPENVPVIEAPGALIRVPLGEYGTAISPMNPPTQITLLDIRLEAEARLPVTIAANRNGFVIPVQGSVKINGEEFTAEAPEAPAFPASSAEQTILLEAGQEAAQAAVFSGVPIQFQE